MSSTANDWTTLNQAPGNGTGPALLYPGRDVTVVSLTNQRAVMKSRHRIKPGTRTELRLLAQERAINGVIETCQLTRLEPVCYEAVFVFGDEGTALR